VRPAQAQGEDDSEFQEDDSGGPHVVHGEWWEPSEPGYGRQRWPIVTRRARERLWRGLAFTVSNARIEGDMAIINAKRGGVDFSYEMRYEEGQWRFQPDAGSLADYAKGADKLIAEKKAAGECS
jgi:hypothetical protein